MLEIYNIEQVSIDYLWILFAFVPLFFGVLLYKIKLGNPSKKELEGPFERIKNLVDLNNKQNEHREVINGMGLLLICSGIIMPISTITPNIQAFYYSHIKTNNNAIGIVQNYNDSEIFNLEMISFDINNIPFSAIKDGRFNQKVGFSNGDSLSVSYTIASNKEVDTITKIIKLNN